MKGDAGEGFELVPDILAAEGRADKTFDLGTREGIGKIQIRSLSRLCCNVSCGFKVQKWEGAHTLSRSSSIRRKMSFRENASEWPRFLGDPDL